MDHFEGSSKMGPEEDPLPAGEHQTTPEPEEELLADLYPQEDGWVTGEALMEILAFDAMLNETTLMCPRCDQASFNYGIYLLCSNGCPENLTVVKQSN